MINSRRGLASISYAESCNILDDRSYAFGTGEVP